MNATRASDGQQRLHPPAVGAQRAGGDRRPPRCRPAVTAARGDRPGPAGRGGRHDAVRLGRPEPSLRVAAPSCSNDIRASSSLVTPATPAESRI